MTRIGVIDYGAGNLQSVMCALVRSGADCKIIKNPDRLEEFKGLILPGVGSFRYAMKRLKQEGWGKGMESIVNSDIKLMGICLGMQVLFEVGYEGGNTNGFGIFEGSVERITSKDGLRVPHMGWNDVTWTKKTRS